MIEDGEVKEFDKDGIMICNDSIGPGLEYDYILKE